ncbi:hypothetical protein Lal_00030070, partial [Lupinus albus]
QALQGNPSPQALNFHGVFTVSCNLALLNFSNCLYLTHQNFRSWLKTKSTFTVLDCTRQPQSPCNFHIPFYLLAIQRVDVILGIEWLSILGPMTYDFAMPSMIFTHDKKPITLTGQQH